MKRRYGTIGFIIATLLFAAVAYFTFRDTDPMQWVEQIGTVGMLQNLLLGMLYFFSFGLIMKSVYRTYYRIDLSLADTFLLPTTMHLWTYVLPIKGGLVYQTFFMRSKYGMGMSKGFSVGVLVFAASLLVTCVVGGSLSLLLEDGWLLQLLLLGMTAGLGLMVVAAKLVSDPDQKVAGPISTLISFIKRVLVQFNAQTRDTALLAKLLLLTLLSTALHAAWFYQSAQLLGFHPDALGILLATLVLRIATLVRVLPGNLGIQEMMTGSVFLAAGLGLQEGLATALLIRFSSVVLAATLGLAGLYLNFRYFGTGSFLELLNRLKDPQN